MPLPYMFSLVCKIIGHKPDRRDDGCLSHMPWPWAIVYCKRCGAELVKNAKGRWVPLWR